MLLNIGQGFDLKVYGICDLLKPQKRDGLDTPPTKKPAYFGRNLFFENIPHCRYWMTPEQAWQATLDQLQMEIPKPTFNKWIRDMRFLTYEDGVMILGFQNSATRDWVEARLKSMIRRILAGVLAQEVALRFEVIVSEHSFDETPDEEVHLPEDTEGHPEDDNEEILVQMDMARQSLYEALVQPERVTVIPGYFLRWIPYLGHQRSWMIVALWQIFFQNYGHKVKPGNRFSASGADIAHWSGLSRRTVVTYLNTLAAQNSDNYFRWFFERVDMEFPETHNGQASRFRFKTTMPLTPGDALALNAVLGNLGIVEKPIAALKTALTYQPKELLPFPAQIPSKDQTTDCPLPTSVQQLVLKLTALTPKYPQYVEILQLASELAGRLIPPKDVLVLSHYFLLNWLPLLGSGPG